MLMKGEGRTVKVSDQFKDLILILVIYPKNSDGGKPANK